MAVLKDKSVPQVPRSTDLEVVGICTYKVARDAKKVLATYALGSCVAVCIHDQEANVGGMIHFMLPEAKLDPARARSTPAMFGDTGLPRLFEDFYAAGGRQARLQCYLVGGASTIASEGHFNIGKRNLILARQLFGKSGIEVDNEDAGGGESRSVYLEVGTGRVLVKRPGGREAEL